MHRAHRTITDIGCHVPGAVHLSEQAFRGANGRLTFQIWRRRPGTLDRPPVRQQLRPIPPLAGGGSSLQVAFSTMIFGMKLPNNQIQKSGAEVWSHFNKAWPASDLER